MNFEIRDTPLTQKIAEKIKADYKSKKLKDVHIKKFMEAYYEGDPNMSCPTGCKPTCLLDCYIDIHQSMVNDEGKVVEFKKLYKRDRTPHCCGVELETLDSKWFCIVCGNEYKKI